ncbi:MAG: hypothetical protein ABIR50_00665 [Ginsengibacter sp.]
MKLLVLLISIFFFISASGQQLSGKINNVTFYKDSIFNNNRIFHALAINRPNYKFLFENEKGKVFESPIDHMRCLAPDFDFKMPVADLPKVDINGNKTQPEPMPNPFLKNNSIPPLLLFKKNK